MATSQCGELTVVGSVRRSLRGHLTRRRRQRSETSPSAPRRIFSPSGPTAVHSNSTTFVSGAAPPPEAHGATRWSAGHRLWRFHRMAGCSHLVASISAPCCGRSTPLLTMRFRRCPALPFFQTNSILSLAFSPNGQVLAAADGDGSICLYDVPSHRAIGGCMTPHESSENLSGMRAVAFTGDGSALLSAGDGNPLEQWNAALWAASGDAASRDRLAAAVCGVAGRNLTEAEWNQAFVDTRLVGKRHRTCPTFPLP